VRKPFGRWLGDYAWTPAAAFCLSTGNGAAALGVDGVEPAKTQIASASKRKRAATLNWAAL